MATEFLKPAEVAERLGIDQSTVCRWIKEEGLPVYGISQKSRWCDWDEVVAWLKARRLNTEPAPAPAAPSSVLTAKPSRRSVVIDLPRRY